MARNLVVLFLLAFIGVFAVAGEQKTPVDDEVLKEYSNYISQAVKELNYDQRAKVPEAIDKLYKASAQGLKVAALLKDKYPKTNNYFSFLFANYEKIKNYDDLDLLEADWKDDAKFEQAGIKTEGYTYFGVVESTKLLIILPIEASILLKGYAHNGDRRLLQGAQDIIEEIYLHVKEVKFN